MGNYCCHNQLTDQHKLETNVTITNEPPIIPPKKALAIKCIETSLLQLCPQLISLADRIKAEQNFKSVKLQDCPIYYLKNMSCFYQGIWKEQLPHGCGIAVYKNNSYYEGQFENGELSSLDGLYVFGNNLILDIEEEWTESTYYIGEFRKSQFSGKGKMYHKGLIYEGEWAKGRRHGQGNQYSTRHSYHYEGSFENGFRNGYGAYKCKINEDLYVYQGIFSTGLFHGQGKLSVGGITFLSGFFLYGRAEGQCTLLCDIGTLKCVFQKGRVNGVGQFCYDEQSKEKLSGDFKEEIVQNPQTHKIVKNIIFGGAKIAEAIFIDFRKLMVDS